MQEQMSLVRPAVCLTLILSFNSLALAGDLNPPPGPVGPTMKTLVEVEPRVSVQSLPGSATALHVITEPGSYYLTGNITGVAGKNGILINTTPVSLDLSGFVLTGVPGSLSGILSAAQGQSIRIYNGSIESWGGDGITADQSNGADFEQRGEFHDLIVANNGTGLHAGLRAGSNAIVERCIARGNKGDGIAVFDQCIVRDCVSVENTRSGIFLRSGTTVQGCTTSKNMIDGISSDSPAIGSRVIESIARSNQRDGIHLAGVAHVVSRSTVNANGGKGVLVGESSAVSEVVAVGNSGTGIWTESTSSVRACTLWSNHDNGIRVVRGCLIKDNNVGGCNPNGILVLSDEGRIIDNLLQNNTFGIELATGGNLIVRNSALGNGVDFAIPAQNLFGPVSTDPTTASEWANFQFPQP